ncbi:hypothetical protein SAMN05444422_101467 [Halobiforma haloterrestris]|uniref:Uncharacterized protein n=1 Tax=Natronobacterium haloterrestre TaxID=148448 RepID=A0A1I1DGD6_NATHA|nr:hypothetical protein [Halobiforma haloterrestris]SFB72118.1 hypothetical protein SAMN05444422_101467 [Halobiforma haloterrestris]
MDERLVDRLLDVHSSLNTALWEAHKYESKINAPHHRGKVMEEVDAMIDILKELRSGAGNGGSAE